MSTATITEPEAPTLTHVEARILALYVQRVDLDVIARKLKLKHATVSQIVIDKAGINRNTAAHLLRNARIVTLPKPVVVIRPPVRRPMALTLITAEHVTTLTLMSEGATNAVIAEHFGISDNILDCRIKDLYRIMAAPNRMIAVVYAIRHGLIPDVVRNQPTGEPFDDIEIQCLQLMLAGRSGSQMRDELGITMWSLRLLQTDLYRKLGVARGDQALIAADRLGLLGLDGGSDV